MPRVEVNERLTPKRQVSSVTVFNTDGHREYLYTRPEGRITVLNPLLAPQKDLNFWIEMGDAKTKTIFLVVKYAGPAEGDTVRIDLSLEVETPINDLMGGQDVA
jgi:hypothetical protein